MISFAVVFVLSFAVVLSLAFAVVLKKNLLLIVLSKTKYRYSVGLV